MAFANFDYNHTLQRPTARTYSWWPQSPAVAA
ncbi:hypothetical protein DFJ69_2171 [Thermomonospora umbrina]|uniref:Uncharacterized protein n=1 Tax=Thermomonospora umbrina TaxID=111806 RepID=A0A3D9SVX0_9ACTN|nr:hypothetical protein DFJ69_2171 [Thermomonospora umbrina]